VPNVRLPSHDDALAGTRAQYALLLDAVAGLPDEAFDRPTRLGEWRVAELVAHTARTAEAVSRYALRTEPGRPDVDVVGYLSHATSVAPAVAQRAAEAAAGRDADALRAEFAEMAGGALDALADPPDLAGVVAARLGVLPYGDFLVTRCVEGVVHGLDLREAAGVPSEPDATALKVTVRVLAAMLATAAPGRSVEVRIPGHLAVQCVEGPRHTRGTPGSVVETDAVTFVELASGRLAWTDAKGLHASGEHSDLSAYLPVIG
jgi:uncharacterized protein (TIGR03083 family)